MASVKPLSCQYIALILITLFVKSKAQSNNITFSLFATNMSGCDPNSDCDLEVSIMCSDYVNEKWELCGKAAKIQDDNNPVWPEVFTLEHNPGTDQMWRFELVDIDFMLDDFIAAIDVDVDDYAMKPENLVSIPVPDNTGTFWIHRQR